MEKSSVLTTNPNGIETLSVSSRNKSTIIISTNTIISSMERDLKELQKELTVRNQKDQIKSILESLKLLKKKCQGFNESSDVQTLRTSESRPQNEIVKQFKRSVTNANDKLFQMQFDEGISSFAKKNSAIIPNNISLNKTCVNCDKLKKELDRIKSDLITAQNKISVFMKTEDSERILREKYEKLNEEYKIIYSQNDNLHSIIEKSTTENKEKISKLEEALTLINIEYDKLCNKIGGLQEKNDLLSEMKEKSQKQKIAYQVKYEEILNVNQELTKKIVEIENRYNLLNEELKKSNARNSKLTKLNSELMSKNKLMIDDIKNKENRLTALREMNTILEKKSNKVIEKLDKLMSSNNN